jgi:hypothetical protein
MPSSSGSQPPVWSDFTDSSISKSGNSQSWSNFTDSDGSDQVMNFDAVQALADHQLRYTQVALGVHALHGLHQIGALVHHGLHQNIIVLAISKRTGMLQACGAIPAPSLVKKVIKTTTQVLHSAHLSLLQNPNQKA